MFEVFKILNKIDDDKSLKESYFKPILTEDDDGREVVDKLTDATNYENFVRILNSDGKSKAFLDYLKSHYKMGDDALGTIKKANPSETIIKCDELQPTQQNISVEKSLGMITKGGWSVNIINDPTNAFKTPTVTYAGKYIIDGHHRWSKVVALNGPESELKVLNFPAISGVDWEDMLKAVELAIVATNPQADLIQSVPNDNMLTAQGAKMAADFYAKNACEEVVEAMKAKGRGEDKAAQAQTVGENVMRAVSSIKPVAGAAKRDFMPQMDDEGNAQDMLVKQGVIDMTEELLESGELDRARFTGEKYRGFEIYSYSKRNPSGHTDYHGAPEAYSSRYFAEDGRGDRLAVGSYSVQECKETIDDYLHYCRKS